MSQRLRCAVYTRKSSEEGLEQSFNSLDAQRESCEAYILSQAGEGWSLVKSAYDDGGYSGGSMRRPGLRQLLADIQRGLIDIIVVYKVDRLTRSLTDFAKMVEQFDAKGVSFVSVTQAFNTTSSMGRLTLNVLLSFAQFEREVTGERIRDKIAASKAKGLRMGGRPPLGYDIVEGRLAVNEAEAERVRAIFKRYLELGSTTALSREGVRGKAWRNRAGELVGGGNMWHGPLNFMLRNEVYLGVTRHKEKRYPNTHPQIVDGELFATVQAKLSAAPASRASRPPGEQLALLAGKVWDDRGHPMLPVHTTRDGRRYRYYVSRPHLRDEKDASGSLPRISAAMLERFLDESIASLLAESWNAAAETLGRVVAAIRKVILSADQLAVNIDAAALRPNVEAEVSDVSGQRTLRFEFHMHKRQGAIFISPRTPGQAPARRIDRIMVRAVVLARTWSRQLETGEVASVKELARQQGLCNHYVGRLLPLAYLAPDLTEAILSGGQPNHLTLSALTSSPLPTDWNAQREQITNL